MIQFDEKTHTYTLNDKQIISVTQLMSKHGLSCNYNNVSENTLNLAAQKGSLIHKEIEQWIKNQTQGFTPELEAFIDIASKYKMRDMISEKIVYNNTCAGTIDIVCTMQSPLTGKTVRALIDVKTTYTINRKACEYQTSLYRYLYESNTGDKINESYALHLRGEIGKLVPLSPVSNSDINTLLKCEQQGEEYRPKTFLPDAEIISQIEQAQALIENIDRQKKEAQDRIELLKKSILESMNKQGVKSFENEKLKITYLAPTIRNTIDTERLRKEKSEIIKDYLKQTNVKANVRIKIKEGDYG